MDLGDRRLAVFSPGPGVDEAGFTALERLGVFAFAIWAFNVAPGPRLNRLALMLLCARRRHRPSDASRAPGVPPLAGPIYPGSSSSSAQKPT